MKDFDGLDYFGKKVEILDVYLKRWTGIVDGYESPEDSEDGKWYLNIEVQYLDGFRLIGIAEDEIKEIKILSQ